MFEFILRSQFETLLRSLLKLYRRHTLLKIQFNSIQIYLYSTFHDTNRCKAALQKILSFYITFRSRLLVVTMAEMYSKNHAVTVIKQTWTLLTAMIICCDKAPKRVFLQWCHRITIFEPFLVPKRTFQWTVLKWTILKNIFKKSKEPFSTIKNFSCIWKIPWMFKVLHGIKNLHF